MLNSTNSCKKRKILYVSGWRKGDARFWVKNNPKVFSGSGDIINREKYSQPREVSMAVQGVDRAAEVAQAQRSERAQATRAENDKRRAEADAAQQEQQAAREADRGNNVDVRG
jgi:ABC-type nitrate/sulfonate/bicarbonate transport system substrate-binding protein